MRYTNILKKNQINLKKKELIKKFDLNNKNK